MSYQLEAGTHDVAALVESFNAGPQSFDPGTDTQTHLVCALVELSRMHGDDTAKYYGVQELLAAMRRVDARDRMRTSFRIGDGHISIRRVPVSWV